MRWKSVALAGALVPGAVGCNIYHLAARNIINEPAVVCTQLGIEHHLRSDARAAWREVRAEYPRRAFTAEFRDGFIDGYVDYLDRGGNGSLPAVPPAKYTRHKKYFTEDGQCLVKDWFLGFKYGQEIAIATGKRQLLTVPVLLPVVPQGPPAFTVVPPGPPVVPVPADHAPGLLHPPAVVLPPGAGPPAPGVVPVPVPPPAPVPIPAPTSTENPRPVPKPDSAEPPPSKFDPPAAREVIPAPSPPIPVPGGLPKLPPPPAEVPTLPDDVPTPSVLDELPVVPPYRGELPVVPPYRGELPVVPPARPEPNEK